MLSPDDVVGFYPKAKVPNIRKLFIPDKGMIIVDIDLTGADAQVVAWEAGDEDLKDAFRKGLKLHAKNSRDMFPKYRDYSDAALKQFDYPGGVYHNVKRAVHATNYGATPNALVTALKWSTREASMFQFRWFELHPKIKEWHERYANYLEGSQCWNCNAMSVGSKLCASCGSQLGRTIKNALGYRIIYFNYIDGLLPQALAWTPQSTVANVVTMAKLIIWHYFPKIQVLLQVHDSLVLQLTREAFEDGEVDRLMKIVNTIKVPYKDPLFIPWGMSYSDKSWGDAG